MACAFVAAAGVEGVGAPPNSAASASSRAIMRAPDRSLRRRISAARSAVM